MLIITDSFHSCSHKVTNFAFLLVHTNEYKHINAKKKSVVLVGWSFYYLNSNIKYTFSFNLLLFI